jgi:terminase small subunit / prophage DNA-packing protein
LAALAQLKLATERAELVEAATVKRDWVSTLTSSRGRLLAIPARVGASLPHLRPTDIATIGAEVRQALEELSHDTELA